MTFRLMMVLFALTLTPAFSEEYIDRSLLLSADEEVRMKEHQKLVDQVATISDEDCEFLIEQAADPQTPPDVSALVLASVYGALLVPDVFHVPGKKLRRLSLDMGEPLLRIAENDKLSSKHREFAVGCLSFMLDGSEKAVGFEDRMFQLLHKDNPKRLREMIVKMPRWFPLKENDNTWKWFVTVLTDEQEDERVRSYLIDELWNMAWNRLVELDNFHVLMEHAFSTNTNSDKMRRKILVKLTGLPERGRFSPVTLEWCRKAMSEDFVHRECSVEYKSDLAEYLSEGEVDNIEVMSETVRLLLDKSTDLELRKDCIKLIRKCQLSEKDFSRILEEESSKPAK